VTARKPFNVTLIQPASYVHALALVEAADYIDASLRACGYESYRTTNLISTRAYNVIICSHMLQEQHAAQLPADTIIFNTEQLAKVDGWYFGSGVYGSLLDRFFVWDYSAANLERVAHDRKALIPFFHCPSLRRSQIGRRPGDALLFYGSTSPRREKILEALTRSGVRVQVLFGKYGLERDREILGSWAVLNLHCYDETVSFESIRCFYPLINDVPVISEEAADASADAYRTSIFFFDHASLVDRIAELYRNPELFLERSSAMLSAFKATTPLPSMWTAVRQFLSRWQ
jgi:hypothetical protein